MISPNLEGTFPDHIPERVVYSPAGMPLLLLLLLLLQFQEIRHLKEVPFQVQPVLKVEGDSEDLQKASAQEPPPPAARKVTILSDFSHQSSSKCLTVRTMSLPDLVPPRLQGDSRVDPLNLFL